MIGVDLAGVDRLHHHEVVLQDRAVVRQPWIHSAARSSPSVATTALTIAWKSAPVGENATRLAHSLGEVHQRGRQLVLAHGVVVDQDGGPGDEARPVLVAGDVLRWDQIEGLLADWREQAGVVDQRHRRGVLGQEHVGRRRVPLLDELVGEFEVLAVAELHLDPGLILEERGNLLE